MKQHLILVNESPMHPDNREDWVIKVSHDLRTTWAARYLEGQKQHASDLGTVVTTQLICELERELLDAFAYLHELKRRIRRS